MDFHFFGESDSQTVLIQPVDEHDLGFMEKEVSHIRELSSTPFSLIACRVPDWNRDLSPWPAPAVFGTEDFGEGASETLSGILTLCKDDSRTYFIGGYSLAGLFALWAVHQTDRFSGVAAASPSVWFPGFTEYCRSRGIPKTGRIFLSLGDREDKTRNPVMATVADRIRDLYDLWKPGIPDCTLVWNEGNHFRDPDIRTASAFAWLIRSKTV